jgi:nucleoid-associated protein YgaU
MVDLPHPGAPLRAGQQDGRGDAEQRVRRPFPDRCLLGRPHDQQERHHGPGKDRPERLGDTARVRGAGGQRNPGRSAWRNAGQLRGQSRRVQPLDGDDRAVARGRDRSHPVLEGDYFYSTFVKAVHDKLNTDITGPDGGVEVENLKGKKWRLAGDKTLAASPQTLEFGREAVAQSRANLKQAEGQKQIDLKKLADQVWAWVPRPTKDGQKQIDDATATLTDPANAASVKAWVAIVVEPQSFQAVQTELLKEGLIRPRTGAGATAVPMPPQPAPATAAPPAAPPAPAPADQAPAAPTTVTVAVNDSLWKIAKARLGAGASDVEIDAYSRRLYEANRALIGDDPDIIMPGVVLQLPPLGS